METHPLAPDRVDVDDLGVQHIDQVRVGDRILAETGGGVHAHSLGPLRTAPTGYKPVGFWCLHVIGMHVGMRPSDF